MSMFLSQYARAVLRHTRAMAVVAVLAVAAVVIVLLTQDGRGPKVARSPDTEVSSQAKRTARFVPTPAQWASLGMEPVKAMTFRSEHMTEGKISINEDKATPIFPPYAGRVTRLMAKPGDMVERGQPLFYIEAADMIQAQNDFLTGLAAINRAKSRVTITEIIEKQNRTLYEGKAGRVARLPDRDRRSRPGAGRPAHRRIRARGGAQSSCHSRQDRRRDHGISGAGQDQLRDADLCAAVRHRRAAQDRSRPIRQLHLTGVVDPVFTIGDLSTVWLVAYVRESEAPKVRAGQQLDFTVLAYPKTTFKANIDHVAASLDPNIRRLMVRATIDNSKGQFKPEMFTSVTIYTDEGDSSLGVPRDAVIYEADNARVWVARADKTIEVRQIKTGITRGGMIQVLQGLQPGEIVVTKGSLFVDQAASSS